MKIKKFFPLLLGTAVGFTIFFFSPVDVFLANQNEFIVGVSDIVIPMAIIAAAVSLLLSGVLFLLGKVFLPAYRVSACLLLGILGAVYFQLLFFNGRMNILDGSETNYEKFDLYNTADLLLFFIILITPLMLLTARNQYKDNAFLKLPDTKKAAFLSAAVLIMQISGTVSLAVSHGPYSDSAEHNFPLLSYEGASKISKDKNIVVFLTDKMDSFWFDDMTERYPEVKEKLDGFTFYRDNLSEHSFTFPSITQMLTGKEYAEERPSDYLKSAWESGSVPEMLHNNGWNVYMLTDQGTVFNDTDEIWDFTDNRSDFSYSVKYTGSGGICSTMIRLSMFRCMPYIYKQFFEYKYSDISNGFFVFDDEEHESAVLPHRIGIDTDIKYHDYISENGLSADSPSPTFSFIHFNAAHDPSEALASLNSGYDGKNDNVSAARGAFENIFIYIDELRRLGVYDSTEIIILGDHGDIPDYIDFSRISAPDVTALLIKPAGASGALKINDTAQLSNKNFGASVLESAGLDKADFGSSYSDIISGGGTQERIFNGSNYYNFGEEEMKDIITNYTYRIVYRVNGNSRDFDSWEQIS